MIKVVSVLAALACCATTLSLAFGQMLSGLTDFAAASLTILTAHPMLHDLGLSEVLALLGAGIVFWFSTRRSEDM
jgi:hypothetical protein